MLVWYTQKREKKIHIIASRRQIETEIMGGGYVNNWSTENLRKYTKKGKIIFVEITVVLGKVVMKLKENKIF